MELGHLCGAIHVEPRLGYKIALFVFVASKLHLQLQVIARCLLHDEDSRIAWEALGNTLLYRSLWR